MTSLREQSAGRESDVTRAYLRVAPEVASALAEGRPVVALESTVIAHGLPRPENVAVALAMEAAIRAEGAIPATIALLAGEIVVGLSAEEIRRLGDEEGVWKASRRDLAVALARERDGGDHGRGDAGLRGAGGRAGLCHGRHRWRASRRCEPASTSPPTCPSYDTRPSSPSARAPRRFSTCP